MRLAVTVPNLTTDVTPTPDNTVGIDMGLKSFLVTSDNQSCQIPQHYRKAEKRLKQLQRQLSRRILRSKRRQKSIKRVAKSHLKVANQRKDFHYKTAIWFNWVFATREGKANPLRLLAHNEFSCSSTDYVKVKGDKSPYDGNLVYWSSRLGTHPQMPNRKAKLLKQQKGKCPRCGLSFQEWDVLEVDHIIPSALSGKDEYKNLQLLHRHCHDEKTALDLKEIRKKNHSKFLEKLSQFWEKFDWEWRNEIPFFKGLKVRKPENDK